MVNTYPAELFINPYTTKDDHNRYQSVLLADEITVIGNDIQPFNRRCRIYSGFHFFISTLSTTF